MVTRGSGPLGLDSGFEAEPRRVIIAGPLVPPPAESYERGIDVVTYRTLRTAEATDAASAKIGNYLVAVLAMRAARAAGAAEALFVDAGGYVVEGASSNVFAVFGGQLVTPPESAGILPGITRSLILELCKETGRSVTLRPLAASELAGADEIFITSSIRELLAVVGVDGGRVSDGKPGPVARQLHRQFLEKVNVIMGIA
jgi:branched-chain amino acid aminotransferase